jgi:hypothetical protein
MPQYLGSDARPRRSSPHISDDNAQRHQFSARGIEVTLLDFIPQRGLRAESCPITAFFGPNPTCKRVCQDLRRRSEERFPPTPPFESPAQQVQQDGNPES